MPYSYLPQDAIPHFLTAGFKGRGRADSALLGMIADAAKGGSSGTSVSASRRRTTDRRRRRASGVTAKSNKSQFASGVAGKKVPLSLAFEIADVLAK